MADEMQSHSGDPVPVPDDIQRLKGRGTIYKEGLRLGESGYDIIVTPPELRRLIFEPGHEPKNTPDITGRLTDAFYDSEVLHDVLTLELEDGRRFEFRVLQPETNDIVGITWLHH